MKLQITLAALVSAALWAASPAWAAGSADAHHHEPPASIGEVGRASQVTRIVQVEMRDSMRFVPSRWSVKQGETLRIVVKNTGQLAHEMVLGSEPQLRAHLEMMKKSPRMAHSEPNTLTLAAGKSGELVWKFSQAGVVNFACLQPGHYQSGMQGQVQVTAAQQSHRSEAHSH